MRAEKTFDLRLCLAEGYFALAIDKRNKHARALRKSTKSLYVSEKEAPQAAEGGLPAL